MKKGFTLVELLAVIVILGVTITIVAVKIDKNLRDANEFGNEQQKNLIENAAYLYAEEYSSELTNFSSLKVSTVTISKLLEKGLIKENDVKNIPKTNVVVIAQINNNIKTKYTETIKNAIFLNGLDEISVNQNSSYIELGAYVAIPGTGLVELTSSSTSSTVNTTIKGKYEVTYSYSGATSIKRIVNVI